MNNKHSIPIHFIEKLKSILDSDDFENVIKTFSKPTPTIFRINTLKTNPKSALEDLEAEPIPHFENAFIYRGSNRENLTYSPAFTEGHLYIQSLSSMLAPIILDPQPGEEILDLTAAPGSKTTQMAAMMKNQGRIAAVEKVKSRFFKLKENCERQGATCVDFYCKDGATVWRSCENRFDRVLLDAPCSSEGRFNTQDPKSYQYWNERKVKEMSRKQWPLLYSAFRSVKSGGILVYSTCTFSQEENEKQIIKLKKKFGDQVILEDIDLSFDTIRTGIEPIDKAIRILPNELMTGFFICKIKKA